MNQYGTTAQKHWRNFRPESYAQIPDPETFFSEMGERAEAQIAALQVQLAGPDVAGEGYLDKVGRLTNARMRAEEIVLREEVLSQPESTSQNSEPDDWDEDWTEPEPVQQEQERSTGWIPTVVDPAHPYWASELQREADDEETTQIYQQVLAEQKQTPNSR
jgi:hypothetical protein